MRMHHLIIISLLPVGCNPFCWRLCDVCAATESYQRSIFKINVRATYIIQLNFFPCSAAQLLKPKGNCYHFLSITRLPIPTHRRRHCTLKRILCRLAIKWKTFRPNGSRRRPLCNCSMSYFLGRSLNHSCNAALSKRSVIRSVYKGKRSRQTTSNALCSTQVSLGAVEKRCCHPFPPFQHPAPSIASRTQLIRRRRRRVAAATLQLRIANTYFPYSDGLHAPRVHIEFDVPSRHRQICLHIVRHQN